MLSEWFEQVLSRRVAGGARGAIPLVLAISVGAAMVGCGDDTGSEESGDGEATDQADDQSDAEAAPEGVVQVLLPEDIELELDPLSGAVGTETVLLTLTGSSQDVPEIGRGEAARQPAEGERFLVVEVEMQDVEVSETLSRPGQQDMAERGEATFSVQVDGADPTDVNLDAPSYSPLPIDLDDPPEGAGSEDSDGPQRRLLVVSAPEDAEQVDLIVNSADLEQRLSLLTGEPGADNIAVLARENRQLIGDVPPQDVTATMTEFGASGSATQAVGIHTASLQWFAEFTDAGFAEPDRAFLQVSVDVGGFNLVLATELRLPDGTVVQPVPLGEDDQIIGAAVPTVSFDVPADFTAGTLVFGKDYSWEVPTGGTMSADFANAVEYQIEIPPSP